MATWAEVHNFTNQASTISVDSNGVDEIYVLRDVGNEDQVYVYDTGLDTLTLISALDTGGSGVVSGPVFFENNLYCIAEDTIYRYSGSGTTWNSVNSLPGFPIFPQLAKSENHLVCSLKNVSVENDLEIRYSSDGSSWNDGTIDSTPSLPSGSYNNMGFGWYHPTNPHLGLYGLDRDQFGVHGPFSRPLRWRLMRWDEGSTTLVTEFWYTRTDLGVEGGDEWVEDTYDFPDTLHWSNQNAYSATLDGTFTAPSNDNVIPVPTVGFNTYSIGWDSPSTNLLFYQMVGADQWDAGEIIDTDANAGTLEFVIRMNNNDIYALTEGAISHIYFRDTPIVDGEEEETGKRLWIFKSPDGGISWSSRGIRVEE